jgi:hypothetical protein
MYWLKLLCTINPGVILFLPKMKHVMIRISITAFNMDVILSLTAEDVYVTYKIIFVINTKIKCVTYISEDERTFH